MLWNISIVSSASAGTTTVTDKTITGYSFVFTYNATSSTIPAVKDQTNGLSFNDVLFTIFDTKAEEEYTITLSTGNFSASPISPGTRCSSYSINYVYFDTIELNSTNYTSARFKSRPGNNIKFDINANEGSTLIYVYIDVSGYVYYNQPAITAGSYYAGNVAKLSMNFTNISYAKQVGGDELLKESKKQTQIQEETKETTKNIFQKISEFFDSFFDGIINAFISLFVPDDEFFEDYFQRLYDFFSEKLGALFVPIEIISQIWDGISNASSSPSITFPGLMWEDVYIIEPQVFEFSSILSEFSDLQEAIYFGTDVVMIAWLLHLFQIKLKEILTL